VRAIERGSDETLDDAPVFRLTNAEMRSREYLTPAEIEKLRNP
jgi:hypothetical protein